MTELRELALCALGLTTWAEKAACLSQVSTTLPIDVSRSLQALGAVPGRPAVELVPPAGLRLRSVHTKEGRAVLLHALAHIEFNAINLALDVVWRFSGMPEAFYRQWIGVAQEESLHFQMLENHLMTLGYRYGDFPAHDGLWEMAERTQEDVLARLALVPRTLEARGLDASPAVRHKLASGGDPKGAAIIDVILRDEIGHVAIGNYWYRWLCNARGLDPIRTYAQLAAQYRAPKLKGPFNVEARLAAGFEPEEIAELQK
ncbi:ferritin-like domain-containing protein [Zwartia sp.]|uniref:ferritin-like domain-containing protein n=1 Tax=Zwartia sp. TaxID=2978004 RepID=UPI0027273243|nr:ferritin-like domain-containing protein [Zwartia sp.]MDO9025140.1 ferritin-like domain-containing protein [Zwartia sp.]